MNPKFNFNYESKTWYLETDIVLSQAQLNKAVVFAKEVYKKRIQGEIGDRRKRMAEALQEFHSHNIKQILVGKGDKFLYKNN